MEGSYKPSFRHWRAKLKQLAAKRDHIEAEIAKCEPVVKALAQSIEDPPERERALAEVESLVRSEGFTDAIRRVLRDSRPWLLTPPEIRDQMIKGGFNLGAYKSPLASIHAILTRLRNKGQVKRAVRDEDDKTAYFWSGE